LAVVNDITDCTIDAEEISKTIDRLKNNKAAGIDGIPSEFIKEAKFKLLPIFLKLFNSLFESTVYPTAWKTAVICPLLKKAIQQFPVITGGLVYSL
jgi:hypothetical protein